MTTTFRPDDRFDIGVPLEMRESYAFANGNNINTVATYGRFRRFDVRAEEEIHSPRPTYVDPQTGMTFVELMTGRFTMGSATGEAGRNEDETLHDVVINRPFLLAQHEVTQQEWRSVMGTSPSRFGDCGSKCPVENVTFVDVLQFVAKLNDQPGATLRYRLPTEAEWEYACRAGTTGPFSTGENLTTAQANYRGQMPYPSFPAGEFRQRTTAVGAFRANPWGFFDMHGNVWEWTADWYGAYPEGDATDPTARAGNQTCHPRRQRFSTRTAPGAVSATHTHRRTRFQPGSCWRPLPPLRYAGSGANGSRRSNDDNKRGTVSATWAAGSQYKPSADRSSSVARFSVVIPFPPSTCSGGDERTELVCHLPSLMALRRSRASKT